jgi:hypothetical protein
VTPSARRGLPQRFGNESSAYCGGTDRTCAAGPCRQSASLDECQAQIGDRSQFFQCGSHTAEHDLWRPMVNALGLVGQAPVRDNNIHSWYGAVGVNINIPVFNGFSTMHAPTPPISKPKPIARSCWMPATTSPTTFATPGNIPVALSNVSPSRSNFANRPASLWTWRRPATISVLVRSSSSPRPSYKKRKPTSRTPTPNTNIA